MLKQGCNSDGELYSLHVAHDQLEYDCSHDGRTRQEFADECDINVLMDRYETTGIINHLAKGEPQYLDVSDVPDLPTALDMLSRAEHAFMQLPAKVRKEFDNSALEFIKYAENPENLDRMREWGLAPPPAPPPEPQLVRVVPEPPPEPPAP